MQTKPFPHVKNKEIFIIMEDPFYCSWDADPYSQSMITVPALHKTTAVIAPQIAINCAVMRESHNKQLYLGCMVHSTCPICVI